MRKFPKETFFVTRQKGTRGTSRGTDVRRSLRCSSLGEMSIDYVGSIQGECSSARGWGRSRYAPRKRSFSYLQGPGIIQRCQGAEGPRVRDARYDSLQAQLTEAVGMPNVKFTQPRVSDRVAREVQGDAGRIGNYGGSEVLGDTYQQTMDGSLKILWIF